MSIRFIERRRKMCFLATAMPTDSCLDALAEWTGRRLDAGSVAMRGMAGGFAFPLPELVGVF